MVSKITQWDRVGIREIASSCGKVFIKIASPCELLVTYEDEGEVCRAYTTNLSDALTLGEELITASEVGFDAYIESEISIYLSNNAIKDKNKKDRDA